MPAQRVRRVAALVLSSVLLVTATACTEDGRPAAQDERRGPRAAPAAPVKVKVTRVSGRLSPKERRALADRVRPAIQGYVDAAFLAGDYPRSSFGGSFKTFTSGAAKAARRDQDLLTNKRLGPTTRSVRAARRTAYLSVLAPHGKVAGVTAAVDLIFVVERGDKTAQRVRLAGRLLLTRRKSGRWAVFGYHLNRADAPMRSAP